MAGSTRGCGSSCDMLVLKKFARDLPAVAGLLIVLAIVVVALLGPWIAPTRRMPPPRICCSA